MTINDGLTAYIAALIDCEGSVSKDRLRLSFSSTDADIADRVSAAFGKPKRIVDLSKAKFSKKTLYTTDINGIPATEFMTLILPYLSQKKRREILAVLAIWRATGITNWGRRK